jgi:pimeloyl-ACP methyl ester carboxylesterase
MKRNRSTYRAATVALVVVGMVVCLAGAAAASAALARRTAAAVTLGPAGLRFYQPPHALPSGRHGTLIWERTYHGVDALSGATNTLVLYTQVGVKGKLVAVSGILSVPKGPVPKGGWPVVSFGHGTTGIADACAPTRAAHSPGDATSSDLGYAPLLDGWIKQRFAIVRTDYEGLGTPGVHPFLIGRSEGYGMLDIVRAARQVDPALSERIVISGHSQGGHAALWAASLARQYTPELRVLGTVAFAPQSHTAEEAGFLKTVSDTGLTAFAGLIFRGLDAAYPSLRVSSLLTPPGAKLYPQTLTKCLDPLGAKSSFGGLPLDHLAKPSANLTPLVKKIALNDPDNLKVKGPVLLEQGLADATVIPAFDQALSQSLAKVGDSVTYHTYPEVTHGGVLAAAATDATGFLRKVSGR